jgi:hypothetical protein
VFFCFDPDNDNDNDNTTNCMQQNPYWQANRFSASQEIPRISWTAKVHYRISPSSLRQMWTFGNMAIFYGSELLPPPRAPSWRTTRCLLSKTAYFIYLQPPSILVGGSSIRHWRTRRAVVTGTHLSITHNW